MQYYKEMTTATFPTPRLKKLLITFAGILLILTGCSQRSTSIADTSNQPVAEEPAVLVGSLMPSDELGIVVDENNEVLHIEVGSAAEQAGIQVGDLLETLDDISFKEKEKVKEKIREPKEGKKFKVKLKRNDKEITLDITPAPRRPSFDASTPTPVFAPQDYF